MKFYTFLRKLFLQKKLRWIYFFLCCISVNALAQRATFDTRFKLKAIDLDNRTAVMELQIKTASQKFMLGDANFRFKINTNQIAPPIIDSERNFSSTKPASNSNYGTQVLSTSGGKIYSLSIVYNNNNSENMSNSMVVDSWKTISEFLLTIQPNNTTGEITLTWLTSANFPATNISSVVMVPNDFSLLPVEDGTYTDFDTSVFPNVPNNAAGYVWSSAH